MGKTFSKSSISASVCAEMIAASQAKAQEMGFNIVIAIVDDSGVLKAFSRMDNAPLLAIGAAQQKAKTAVGFGMSTGDAWHDFIKGDPILEQGVQNLKDFTLLGGGSPIMIDDQLVGAIGVSGGHYKQDEECAAAGLAAISA